MTDELKDRIAKIYALVNQGATDGERKAAKAALDRLMKKYDLDGVDLENIDKKYYSFRYTSHTESCLLGYIMSYFWPDLNIRENAYITNYDSKALTRCRMIRVRLTYVDYITLDSAYEYFRRHMKAQWKKTCAPILARCRKAKTRNRKRSELQAAFLEQYVIKSGLVRKEDITQVPTSELSAGEQERQRAIQGVEGGQYSTQVQNGPMGRRAFSVENAA